MSDGAALTSLAILKVNFDNLGEDYIENLVPFVSHVLIKFRPDPVTATAVQNNLKTEFALTIPVHPLELVLRRLARRRNLEKVGREYRLVREPKTPDIEGKRANARRHYERVIEAFRTFSSEKFSINIPAERAEAALISYLSRFSIDFLKAFSGQEGAIPTAPPVGGQDLFLMASFVSAAESAHPDVFDSLVILVKGHMLSNALLCADLDAIQRKFGDVTFYLDTPFLVKALGLDGAANEMASKEVLDLLVSLDGKLAVFQHTFDELRGVLSFCERQLNAPDQHAPIILAARRALLKKTDIILLRERLEDHLKALRILLRPNPRHERAFEIDQKTLRVAIQDEIEYLNPRALECDEESIRSIYSLREGAAPQAVENCRALLVTTNAALARAAYEFGKANESSREVSTVVTDFSIANVAWLKAPLAAPGLPAREMMSLCYAALEPPPELWSKYLREIESLTARGMITPRDHEVLRVSLHARDDLMHFTLGSESALTEHTVTEILDRVKSDLTLEKEVEILREKVKLTDSERERARLEANHSFTVRRLKSLAEWAGRLLATGVAVVLTAVLGTGLLLGLLGAIQWKGNPAWVASLISLTCGVTLLFGLWNWFSGVAVRDVERRVRTWVESRAFKKLSERFLNQRPPED